MRTVKRYRGDHWRINFVPRFLDENGEPLLVQPLDVLDSATFRSTLKDSYGGSDLWSASPSDVIIADPITRKIEVIVPAVVTGGLTVADEGTPFLLDLEVTTNGGVVMTPAVIKILAFPDLSV
jgi:hypothetical protein